MKYKLGLVISVLIFLIVPFPLSWVQTQKGWWAMGLMVDAFFLFVLSLICIVLCLLNILDDEG
jgi:hypothetical protein